MTRTRQITFAACVLALVAASALTLSAQTPCATKCQVKVGEKFTVQFDHDPAAVEGVRGPTIGYRVYLDGKKVGEDLPLERLIAGTVTVTDTVVTVRGSHNLAVAAFNADGESKRTAMVLVIGEYAPGDPTNLRIQIAAAVSAGSGSGVIFHVSAAAAE